jgi:hypothetical protein
MASKARKSKVRKSKARKSLRTKNKQKSRRYRKKSRRIIKTQRGGTIDDLEDLMSDVVDVNKINEYRNNYFKHNPDVRDIIIDIAALAKYYDMDKPNDEKKYFDLSIALTCLYVDYGITEDDVDAQVVDITQGEIPAQENLTIFLDSLNERPYLLR